MIPALDIKYKTVLDNIKSSIQLSEELKTYLDTEEDDDYKALVTKYENEIHELYTNVANNTPLELIALERALMDEQFEGLYLPKALGYAVLRGRVNERIKYERPQDHYADILSFICKSSNFEQIRLRVGQSIQIGFAMSSDIWITNFLANVQNKKAKTFLESQRFIKYRDQKQRNTALVKYRKQFQSLNFSTVVMPENMTELLVESGSLKDFLIYRGLKDYNNESLTPALRKLINNSEYYDSKEFYELCLIIGAHFDLEAADVTNLKNALTGIRANHDQDSNHVFELLNAHSDKVKGLTIENEKKLSAIIDKSSSDKIASYFTMLDAVNSLGYVHQDAIHAVREYYYQNEGLSDENEAVRKSILSKLSKFLNNLTVEEYPEYFEINKVFTEYMEIFSNQKFNQDLKDLSLVYIRKCLRNYKDKRSKEYQDIKKFVKTTFIDHGFMTDKQLTDLFKTKRKPRTTTA